MKKIYLILAALVVFFMVTSTVGIAADLGLSSSSSESEIATASTESTEEVSSSGASEVEITESAPSVETSEDPGMELLNSGNNPPVADFTYNQNPDNEFEFWFYDQSKDSDGYIVSWYWNFNDGTESTEQNPIKNFEQSAGQTLTISLTVWDDGSAYDYIEKNIKIPSDVSLSEESSSIIIGSEEQSASQSESSSSSSSSTTQTAMLRNYILNKIIPQGTGNLLMGSKIFNNMIYNKMDIGECSMGNPCDLALVIVSYTPAPPEAGANFTIWVEITNDDDKGVYTGDNVRIEVSSEDLGISSLPFTRPFNGDPQFVYFPWPEDITGKKHIDLTVYPLPSGSWDDMNWLDNSDFIYDGPEGVGVGQPVNMEYGEGIAISAIPSSSSSYSSGTISSTTTSVSIVYGSNAL